MNRSEVTLTYQKLTEQKRKEQNKIEVN